MVRAASGLLLSNVCVRSSRALCSAHSWLTVLGTEGERWAREDLGLGSWPPHARVRGPWPVARGLSLSEEGAGRLLRRFLLSLLIRDQKQLRRLQDRKDEERKT